MFVTSNKSLQVSGNKVSQSHLSIWVNSKPDRILSSKSKVQPTKLEPLEKSEIKKDKNAHTMTSARSKTKITPSYPYHSRINFEEGRVGIEFFVAISGKAKKVRVIQSSGFERLDNEAVLAIKKASFYPATNGRRKIGQNMVLFFNFNLNHK